VRAALRIVGSTAALVAIYYALPLTHASTWAAVTILVIGLVLFIGLAALQVRGIIRSPFPGLRAVEALATSVPLFLLLFASSYVAMAAMSAGNFGAGSRTPTACTSPSPCSRQSDSATSRPRPRQHDSWSPGR
jgi:hypothetical protein